MMTHLAHELDMSQLYKGEILGAIVARHKGTGYHSYGKTYIDLRQIWLVQWPIIPGLSKFFKCNEDT